MIDLFSRKVVGWSMSSRMKAALVCDALKMALWQRKPKAGLIVHSDRGSQYASDAYNYLLKAWKCTGSMSRKGNCWDWCPAYSRRDFVLGFSWELREPVITMIREKYKLLK